jgi:hypothetical protein
MKDLFGVNVNLAHKILHLLPYRLTLFRSEWQIKEQDCHFEPCGPTLGGGGETRLPKHVGQARPNAPHGTGWNFLGNQWAS